MCKSFIDRIIALFGVTIIGSQSNEDGDVNENGKKSISLDWQNKFARASRFFVHFIAVVARLRREMPFFTFYREDVNTRQRLSII